MTIEHCRTGSVKPRMTIPSPCLPHCAVRVWKTTTGNKVFSCCLPHCTKMPYFLTNHLFGCAMRFLQGSYMRIIICFIWRFPEIGVPLNHPFCRIFHYEPTILGYPNLWKPLYMVNSCNLQAAPPGASLILLQPGHARSLHGAGPGLAGQSPPSGQQSSTSPGPIPAGRRLRSPRGTPAGRRSGPRAA